MHILHQAPGLSYLNLSVLWFLCKTRINLSPFTKDFRAEEQIDEFQLIFQSSAFLAELATQTKLDSKTTFSSRNSGLLHMYIVLKKFSNRMWKHVLRFYNYD